MTADQPTEVALDGNLLAALGRELDKRRPAQQPASNSESRKRNQPEPHWDPAVVALIERERRAAAVEALRSAASVARWMEYPASQDPRHWAKWLNARADRIGAGS